MPKIWSVAYLMEYVGCDGCINPRYFDVVSSETGEVLAERVDVRLIPAELIGEWYQAIHV